MSFYPTIDYQGAARDIVGQWSDLPRVDRERENTAMQRQLQEKQMTLYGLQMQKAQMEMDQAKQDDLFQKTLGADILLHQERGDFSPSTQEYTATSQPELGGIPGDQATYPQERTLSAITPPKINFTDFMAKKLLAGGKIKEAVEVQKQAVAETKMKQDITDKQLTQIAKYREVFGEATAKSLQKQLSKTNPMLADIDIQYDNQGDDKVRLYTLPGKDKPSYVSFKQPDGKWTPLKETEDRERADSLPKLSMEYAQALEDGDIKKARKLKTALNAIAATNYAGRPIPPIAVPTEGGGMGLASRTSPGAITDIPGAVGKQDKPVGLKATDKAEMNSAIAEKRRLNKLLSEPTAMVSKVKEKIAAGTPLTTREREWKNQWDNAEQTIQRVSALEDSQGSSQSKMKKVTKLPEGSRNTGHKGPHGRPLFVTPDNRYFEAD